MSRSAKRWKLLSRLDSKVSFSLSFGAGSEGSG